MKPTSSELLKSCQGEGPQVVTRRGAEAAVPVPADQSQRLAEAAKPSLKELLLSRDARAEIHIPTRGQARWRKPRDFR